VTILRSHPETELIYGVEGFSFGAVFLFLA